MSYDGQKQKTSQQAASDGLTYKQSFNGFDLNQCISMLHSPQLKQQGLDVLAPIMTIQNLSAMNLNAVTVNNLFRGLRTCLQSNEAAIEILMKVN